MNFIIKKLSHITQTPHFTLKVLKIFVTIFPTYFIKNVTINFIPFNYIPTFHIHYY